MDHRERKPAEGTLQREEEPVQDVEMGLRVCEWEMKEKSPHGRDHGQKRRGAGSSAKS